MKKLLVILGSTATGKTDLAINLAHKFNGELVSADSRQVYKKLDIGTGKYPNKFLISNFKFPISKKKSYWEINGIKVWMYDVVSPSVQYNVAEYVKDASLKIEGIRSRGKLPILVGGTGLYIRALVNGMSNLEISVDKNLRQELEKFSKEQLQKKLQEISQKKWNSMNNSDKENPRRLIRAIETEILPRKTTNSFQGLIKYTNLLKIGLTSERENLYQRVDKSVSNRIKQGMIKEVEELKEKGLTLKRMRQLGLEYGVLADYLEGKVKDKEELINILQGKIHGFVRRQLTWFKKEKDVNWFDISDKKYSKKVEEKISIWYDKEDAN